MTQHYFSIGEDAWGVVVCYDIGREDLEEIGSLLSELGAKPLKIEQALRVISTVNSGFTYTNYDKRMSLMCIGAATSEEQYFDSVLHEVKHLVEHISTYYGVSSKGEPAAYLQGEVGRQIYRGTPRLICPECGKEIRR